MTRHASEKLLQHRADYNEQSLLRSLSANVFTVFLTAIVQLW